MTYTSIRASIGDKALSIATAIFDGTLNQLMSEIVQNSRRAGATRIRFRLLATPTGRDLVISDDGRGLDRSKAPVLLAFAGSSNSREVEAREQSAGMGFHALSQHDVTVESRGAAGEPDAGIGWRMFIPRAAFSGKDEARLWDDRSAPEGFKLTMHAVSGRKDYRKLATGEAIVASMRHSGLTAILEGFGDKDGEHAPVPFIAPHDRMTSYLIDDDGRSTVIVSRSWTNKPRAYMNFHGKKIQVPEIDLKDFREDDVLQRLPNGGMLFESSHIEISVDVSDASCIRFQLPHRDCVIEDDLWAAMEARIRGLAIRLLCDQGVPCAEEIVGLNGVAFDSDIRKEARAMGLEMPLPSIRVPGMKVMAASTPAGHLVTPAGAVIEASQAIAFKQTDYSASLFDLAVVADDAAIPFFSASSLQQAFGSDGAYRRIESIELITRAGDDEEATLLGGLDDSESPLDVDLDEDEGKPELPHANEKIDALGLRFTMTDETVHTLDLSAFFWQEEDDRYSNDVQLIATPSAAVGDVVNALVEGLDWYREESDSDTKYTQKERAEKDFLLQVRNVVLTEQEAMIITLSEMLEDHGWSIPLPDDLEEGTFILKVKKNPFGRGKWTIEPAAIAAPTQIAA